MTPQDFLNTYNGQSLLYAPSPARAYLTGQCVQAVCFFVVANGKPVIWADAFRWWSSGQYPESYDRIPNTPDAVPQPGDLIIWSPFLPNSGGAGHIAVCLRPLPGTGTFISIDSNWSGKYLHKVTHDYKYVVGWLRMKNMSPAPQSITQGEDMTDLNIARVLAFHILGRNGREGRPNALNGEQDADLNKYHVGKPTNAKIMELYMSPESLDYRDHKMQDTYNRSDAYATAQEQSITLRNKINELTVAVNKLSSDDQADKQAIQDGLKKIAELTAQISTTHDSILTIQSTPEVQNTPSLLVRFLALFIKNK